MAGIFAPEMGVTESSVSTPRTARQGTLEGIGGALGNLGNFFGSLQEDAPDRAPTSKEAEAAALAPLARQLRKINQIPNASQRRIRIRTAYSNWAVSNSAYVEEGLALTKALTNIDATPEMTAEDAVRSGLDSFLQTPQGQWAAAASMVRNPDGSPDQRATNAALSANFQQYLADQARAAQLSSMADMSEDRRKIFENNQTVYLPAFIEEKRSQVRQISNNIVEQFLVDLDITNPIDAAQAQAQLLTLRAELATAMEDQAAALGYITHDDFDLDDIMGPLNKKIELISSADNFFDLIEETQAAATASERLKFGEAFNRVSDIPNVGHQEDLFRVFVESVYANNLDVVDRMARSMSENANVFGGEQPFRFNLNPSPTLVGPDQAKEMGGQPGFEDPYSEEAIEKAAELPEKERLQVAQNGLVKFKAFTEPERLAKPSVRSVVVKGLAEALVNIRTQGPLMSEDTFDNVFDSTFFRVYGEITKTDDEASNALKVMVGDFLYKEINNRVVALDRDMVGRGFSSIHLQMDDNGTAKLAVGPNFKNSTAPGDVSIRNLLEKLELPLNNEGLQKLINLQGPRGRKLTSDALRPTPLVGVISEMGENSTFAEIRKLNKALFASRALGTVGQVVHAKAREHFNAREVVVTTEEEIRNLPDGTKFVLVDPETGEPIIHDVK